MTVFAQFRYGFSQFSPFFTSFFRRFRPFFAGEFARFSPSFCSPRCDATRRSGRGESDPGPFRQCLVRYLRTLFSSSCSTVHLLNCSPVLRRRRWPGFINWNCCNRLCIILSCFSEILLISKSLKGPVRICIC